MGNRLTQDRYVQVRLSVVNTLPWTLIDSFHPTISSKIYVTCTVTLIDISGFILSFSCKLSKSLQIFGPNRFPLSPTLSIAVSQCCTLHLKLSDGLIVFLDGLCPRIQLYFHKCFKEVKIWSHNVHIQTWHNLNSDNENHPYRSELCVWNYTILNFILNVIFPYFRVNSTL